MLEDNARVTITGHTHVQGVREFEEGVVMNPGSVGQPRDGDPEAAFAVLDIDDKTDDIDVKTHRVAYDIDRVVDAVEEAGLPEKIGTRLRQGR
jgi:predicted phosphodiesterase